jgi:inner membrane protein
MTETGHRLTGIGAGMLAIGLAAALSKESAAVWLAAGAAFWGSTAPDWLEFPYGWKPVKGRKNFRKRLSVIPHRTVTHLPWPWLTLVILGIWGIYYSGWMAFFFGFGIGGLTHLVMDIPNPMGIPVWNPNHRISLHWWKSGEHELELTLAMLGLGFLGMTFLPHML